MHVAVAISVKDLLTLVQLPTSLIIVLTSYLSRRGAWGYILNEELLSWSLIGQIIRSQLQQGHTNTR